MVLGGSRLLDRVAAALAPATDDVLIVANDPAADAWLPGTRRVPDIRRGVGPLGGIHAALVEARGAILAVAWDMPFVTTPLLLELRRRARPSDVAVVPERAPQRIEPLCAYYAPACRTLIDEWLRRGESSVAGFLAATAGVRRLSSDDVASFGDPARLFFSVDDAAALERAESLQ